MEVIIKQKYTSIAKEIHCKFNNNVINIYWLNGIVLALLLLFLFLVKSFAEFQIFYVYIVAYMYIFFKYNILIYVFVTFSFILSNIKNGSVNYPIFKNGKY